MWGETATVLRLEQRAEFLVEGGLGGGTYELVDEFAVFEEEDGGDVAHAELHGEVFLFVDIALADNDAAVVVVGQF